MMERAILLVIYWGGWLLLPALVDGINALVLFVQVGIHSWRRRRHAAPEPDHFPGITVVVPVYNGEGTLAGCLESLRLQRYPSEQLEIIVVDNGSTDRTQELFEEQQSRSFRGRMHWMSIAGRGKSYALNAGLHVASHPYICTIDADAVVHPDALNQMVRHFEANRTLAAATGTVEVLPASESIDHGPIPFIIAECEFQEYLSAFWLGRQGQMLSQSMYTLAGVFSFFRRDVLLKTFLYDKQTVSEDTKITFDIRNQFGGDRLACIPEAVVYVTPTPSLGALYSQRVRWQRGELEVAAVNESLIDGNVLRAHGLALGRILLIDHTFLFPRLVWTFLFPLLVFFGYPLSLIVNALGLIYLFYVVIAAGSALSVCAIATPAIRSRLRRTWWITAVIPMYRFLIYGFRLAGSIAALTEPAEWQVRPPWTETKSAVLADVAKLREKVFSTWGGD